MRAYELLGGVFRIHLITLGTGNPLVNPLRAGPSNYLQIGSASLLIDVGNGALRRLVETGRTPEDIDTVFITHLHSDHTVDLAHVLISGWINSRTKPVNVIGPAGTKDFVDKLLAAFEVDFKLRRLEDRVGKEIMTVETTEIHGGESIKTDGWTVGAIEVEHGYVKPALGFVFEEDGKRLVISGDTTVSASVEEAATEADVLVHELHQVNKRIDPHEIDMDALPEFPRRIIESHICPHQLGPLVARAGVGTVVATHFPPQVDEPWARDIISADYKGKLVFADDLYEIDI